MKPHWIKVVLGVLCTLLGLIVSVLLSFGEMANVQERSAIIWVGIVNLIWLIPYLRLYVLNEKKLAALIAIFIYSIFLIPFIIIWIYAPTFDSEQWKSSLSTSHFYGDKPSPAHEAGHMVKDIIKSEILIGQDLLGVQRLLGKHHFSRPLLEGDIVCYFYSNRNIFDPCDMICLRFEMGKCVSAGIGDCD